MHFISQARSPCASAAASTCYLRRMIPSRRQPRARLASRVSSPDLIAPVVDWEFLPEVLISQLLRLPSDKRRPLTRTESFPSDLYRRATGLAATCRVGSIAGYRSSDHRS